jgi:hypothetical protein
MKEKDCIVTDASIDKYAENKDLKESLLDRIGKLRNDFIENEQVKAYLNKSEDQAEKESKVLLEVVNEKLRIIESYIKEFTVESERRILSTNIFFHELNNFYIRMGHVIRKVGGKSSLLSAERCLESIKRFDEYLAIRVNDKELFINELTQDHFRNKGI